MHCFFPWFTSFASRETGAIARQDPHAKGGKFAIVLELISKKTIRFLSDRFKLIMSNIIIKNIDDELKKRLEKRAKYYGRSLEEEAKEILRAVLKENPLQPQNLAIAIERRFADLGDFELPTISREPLREPPNFED